ncbi:TetR/AcrR family transcriptional regulator (plasmid) [Pseudorhodobacter turbinis]|uniref:TetR/AcrR family transcriptional regulator n=1 Tax=Pseudorhodobacter turbinis TaxID=2500533 RepID=A0A4P8EKL8_9RHOB|nr:TetR/AcrR family transcriptional regulator [Pseudorhodobacter turbinis]QCO57607.1 TetR/AcrR family transcriptional regulator [Pseudorhodobacter turbinis]
MEIKAPKSRRYAAGQDPAKRDAILEGAARVFMESGFDAASVNDICRAADVSKSTLYVYFNNKEDLFEALIERERSRVFLGLEECLRGDRDFREKLYDFTFTLAQMLCTPEVIRSQRTVIAMAERIPQCGSRFYDGGGLRMKQLIQRFLEDEVAKKTLEIADTTLAAYQLIELSSAGLWRQCLFNKIPSPPPTENLRTTSRSAVDVFLAMYCRHEA